MIAIPALATGGAPPRTSTMPGIGGGKNWVVRDTGAPKWEHEATL